MIYRPTRRVSSLRSFRAVAAVVAAGMLLGGCGTVRGWLGDTPEADPGVSIVPEAPDDTDGPRVPYDVTFSGVDGELLALLQDQSRLLGLVDQPPVTALALRRRTAEDADRLVRALHSRGHYGATIEAQINADVVPATVVLEVDPGPVYTLTSFDVDSTRPGAPLPTSAALGIETGIPAEADMVLAAVQRVPVFLRERGYPDALVVRHTARVNHADRTMGVVVEADPGPFARFGPVMVSGTETVSPDHVRRHVVWRQGDAYDLRRVQEVRRALVATGLFDSVTVSAAQPVDQDGAPLPMEIEVSEADHRSIGAGARFSSTLGLGVNLFWEHRNLFGGGERIRPALEVAQQSRRIGADFEKPLFLGRRDQTLRLTSEVTDETLDAYDRRGILASGEVERRLSPTWTGSLGTSLEYARLRGETDGDRTSALWGVPVRLWRDATDDRLDPRRGVRVDLGVTPFWGTYDGPVMFTRSQAGVRVYRALDAEQNVVLAARAMAGSLIGAARHNVPMDRRFYAGGGGSVRGYGYQLAGDLDARNHPIGGRSVFEIGAELRWQVTDTIGIVPFIEGGRTFATQLPQPTGSLFWGAGLGGRYFSPVGPIRLDVAVPLERRPGVDDPFQVYISLGQAF